MKQRKWFDVKAAADESAAEFFIFDFIGDWFDDLWQFDGVTTAKSFVDALAALPDSVKDLLVRINSPGGDFFGGVTIANALRAEQERGRTVTTVVEGLAGSAASVVAMGGSEVRIADNGLFMIHAPWSVAAGNAGQLRAHAETLDQLRDSLVKTYQWHSELDSNAIVAIIDGPDGQGTWLDADAAVEHGFATKKVEGLKAAASIDPRSMAKLGLKIPSEYEDRIKGFLAAPKPAGPGARPCPRAEGGAAGRERCAAALPGGRVPRLGRGVGLGGSVPRGGPGEACRRADKADRRCNPRA